MIESATSIDPTLLTFIVSVSCAVGTTLLGSNAYLLKRILDQITTLASTVNTVQVGQSKLEVRVDNLQDGFDEHGRRIEHLHDIITKKS